MTRTRSSVGRGRTKFVTIALAVGAMVAALLSPTAAYAAADNPTATPLVSFTFDDSQQSALTQAAPTLQKYGLTGTNYVITNCVGMTTVPNTCRANTDVPYLTWDQVTQLQNTYGWEIGSHTVDHQCLVSSGGDCQKTKLTAAQVEAELADSKTALTAHGFNPTAFAPPYGDYDMSAVARIAKYYTSMRGFADTGSNIWPLGDYLLRDVPVQEVTTPVATLKAKVDDAIANKTWVVFTFHDIRPAPSQVPDDYEYGTAELDQLAAYVQTKVAAGQIKNVNISNALVNGTPNKLANPTFNNGIADGWRTDAPATITADAANNGSYPDYAKSVKLVSGTTTSHLFSPTVPVSPTTTYMFKSFLNVAAISSGEVGFYVDEYNSAGKWISGQYRKRENSRWVESMNFTYTPSSTSVASASLQIWVAGTGITAYVDNVQMLALGAETTPPPPTNLVANGTFDAGISSGWMTDSAATIVADAANNGSPANPVNSVKMTATTANKHLFSPQIAVTPGTYEIAGYLNVTARTSGEVGFYIDEYNAAGQWISGQYKLGIAAAGVANVDLTYSPSTTAVAKASLQVIVQGNSGLQAYFDDVRWWRP
ncbi:polysaccharide deacetylase family protein [Arthrobacter oryzae]|uniref:Polysaccharide deacetylase n=1 Tax=Arthrobacter oryzae TaxID=409290 RepID=A0A495EVX1_9MICC|nr:polysaccharide deacetylase family protein [Arthrobacter oryzae]RKR20719.1 polysaccharide deacetylase [Arthrobacter oryzae]